MLYSNQILDFSKDIVGDRIDQISRSCLGEITRSDSGEPIQKHYHVILHYEEIAEAESKFEARHNTILGNTVVENANISVIEISPDIPIEPLEVSWH
jgi:hypothetical protein